MKPILYVNNFRGFKNTFLQLERVNFLIGENSTGKTSILKLIKILSDPEFWFKNDSQHFKQEFGYYSEITEEDHFEVGLISIDTQKFVNLKFGNNNGFAELIEIKQLDTFVDVRIKLTKRTVEYKLRKGDYSDYFKESFFEYFKNWIENINLDNEDLHVDKTLKDFHVPLILQIQIVLSNHLEDKERSKGFKVPFLVGHLTWLAPIRTEPKRTYDDYELKFSPEGTHVPYLLKKQFTNRKSTKQNRNFEAILNRFGQDSGMFEKITVSQYNKSNLSPFDINIVINGKPLKMINVGYGVSQILPLIVETVIRPNESWFGLQQPEIHLHPRAQAAFGDLLFKSALIDKKGFIVETHSDYIIDRYRLKMSKHFNPVNQDIISSQVVFFYREHDGNHLAVIKINSDGSYSNDQPIEFKEFFIKEEMALLQI